MFLSSFVHPMHGVLKSNEHLAGIATLMSSLVSVSSTTAMSPGAHQWSSLEYDPPTGTLAVLHDRGDDNVLTMS
jgi:hypothetical protein